MSSTITTIEHLAIQEYGIILEEVATAVFDDARPSEVSVLNQDSERKLVELRGLCNFYVPINAGDDEEFRGQPFSERMRRFSTTQIDDVEVLCARMTRRDIHELFKETERYQRTELYNAYLKRSGKNLVVIVG